MSFVEKIIIKMFLLFDCQIDNIIKKRNQLYIKQIKIKTNVTRQNYKNLIKKLMTFPV